MKTRTLRAGNKGFALLEKSHDKINCNLLIKADSGEKSLIKYTFRGRNSKAGFTLLELVIVLFIIGLASAVVVFSAVRIYEKTVFNEEARRLFQTIRHAREISLMERRDIIFNLDEDQNKYWIEYSDKSISSSHSVHRGFGIKGEAIFFFPKGNSSGGSIKINNGKGQEYTIEVDQVLGTPALKRF